MNTNDKYIGQLLDGRYEILELIGEGGMAIVYKALDHRLNRSVAVKILRDEMARDAVRRCIRALGSLGISREEATRIFNEEEALSHA